MAPYATAFSKGVQFPLWVSSARTDYILAINPQTLLVEGVALLKYSKHPLTSEIHLISEIFPLFRCLCVLAFFQVAGIGVPVSGTFVFRAADSPRCSRPV